jgi:MIP family channel proteins
LETQNWWKPCLAEFVGAFALTFVGAGAIVATQGSNLVGIAFAHGLTIAVMVIAVGHISGGHFNPAVTIAMLFTKKISVPLGLLYIIAQLLGSIFGAFLLVSSFPENIYSTVALGTPMVSPAITVPNALVIEAVLTFFLVFVIFGAAIDGRNHMKAIAGLAIGLTVTLDILMGGPLTGAAMNPARAFGTALLSGTWTNHLIYWFGPIIGGIIAGLVYDNAFLAAKKEELLESPPAVPGESPESPGTT